MQSAVTLRADVHSSLLTRKCFNFTMQSTCCHDSSESQAVEVLMNVSLMKQPSAWLPVAMSLAALAMVLGHIAVAGIAPQADEGTAAHLWQLLMAGQVPVVAYFAIKWLPQDSKQALRVLALQACAGLAALFPVYWLGW